MVLCAKVERENAESVRRKLALAGIFDGSFVPGRDEKFVYFAVRGQIPKITFVQRKLEERTGQGKSLAEELQGKLSADEANELVKSFDIVGLS